ncbi:hypothetical protein CgunFtcFv8_006963 [Champsocephalus gunnari]|uniref:Uncharacterized protein n=1 Tax=Champsocephalus gunnari TaxID=52237 RepID=A0AAN8H5F0_CHAGU|nr:hypothetical protein CgunFtcFv8_006963 [Champsocephalus gunnari]
MADNTIASYSYVKKSITVSINHIQPSSLDVNGAARGTQVEVLQERVVQSGSRQVLQELLTMASSFSGNDPGPPLAERQGGQLPGAPDQKSAPEEGLTDYLNYAVATAGAVAVLGMLINKI